MVQANKQMRYEYAAAGSAAYDLSRFERRQPAAPQMQVIKNASPRPRLRAQSIVLFLVCAVLVATMIYSNIRLNEAYTDIAQKSEELALLENEQIRLEMEVGSKVSLSSVEDHAKSKLGLGSVESYQVEYVSLVENSKIEVFRTQDESVLRQLVSDVRAFLGI